MHQWKMQLSYKFVLYEFFLAAMIHFPITTFHRDFIPYLIILFPCSPLQIFDIYLPFSFFCQKSRYFLFILFKPLKYGKIKMAVSHEPSNADDFELPSEIRWNLKLENLKLNQENLESRCQYFRLIL